LKEVVYQYNEDEQGGIRANYAYNKFIFIWFEFLECYLFKRRGIMDV
jgi:hypothetical protein